MDEQVQVVRAYADDPGYDPEFHPLVDMSDCHFPDVYFDDVRHLAFQMRKALPDRSPDARRAVWAPEDVPYGVSRMLEMVLSEVPFETTVFRSAQSAMDHLSVDRNSPEFSAFGAEWQAHAPRLELEQEVQAKSDILAPFKS